MPQLNTSTWFITILSMILTLFIVFQLKILKYNYPETPTLKLSPLSEKTMPWEKKWTKIYLPLSLPQR
uniref:ATP synthase complex subunit 8 n=2 Tax=Arctotherium sp. TaxID=1825730 RepID=A0A160DR01_9CARN|nr:ATP synthase F0 subunit 8 [Arctotherium sp.]ANA91290.1 ATP synthase F0 subunit 8 [Arctotherium sp.]